MTPGGRSGQRRYHRDRQPLSGPELYQARHDQPEPDIQLVTTTNKRYHIIM